MSFLQRGLQVFVHKLNKDQTGFGLESVEHTDLSSDSSYLFTPAVKSSFHLPPGLRIVTPLHQWKVMGIFQCNFILPIWRLVQSIEITVGQAALTQEDHTINERGQSLFIIYQTEFYWYKLTQFTLGENKKRVFLIYILVKFYGEFTYELGGSFDFLWREEGSQKQERINRFPGFAMTITSKICDQNVQIISQIIKLSFSTVYKTCLICFSPQSIMVEVIFIHLII